MLQGMGSFVIAVLSGYLFLIRFNFTKYRMLKESGYHVLFGSACVGVILFTLSSSTLTSTINEHIEILEFLGNLVPTDNAATLSFTFLLGILLPFPLNLFYSAEKATKDVATHGGDIIELLINESLGRSLPIHLSLRSGKCYIGYAIKSHFTGHRDSDVALLPVASGYRDKDTHELVITTSYSSIIREFSIERAEREINDFRIIIPRAEIVSVRYFDSRVFDRFQEYKSSENH